MLPLFPAVAALTSGGKLVAHSAGGLIVLSSTGSYVAGTYISTAALASFLTGTTTALAVSGTATAIGGAAMLGYGTISGAVISLVGSAGFFGTTIGATGITGFLMSIGLVPAVPVIIPISIAFFSLSLLGLIGYKFSRRVKQIRQKATQTPTGEEARFTQREAKTVEKILKNAGKPHSWFWRTLMNFLGRRA
ncbi:hypothetical protein OS190_03850 [Sulfitobacter sp. F26204]|uniref:hypothetical protein n=1 Tax=Sulfitobacter sp. F26204 TaxID=2996014 RepID=UPI00225E42F7|nr:hypothetical protein [Sulfitobacter sp. F26204]MCX7558687.1 hypothetical protein [Sulfitobacter sp. F26204]